jgi:hypothetical protein
VVAMQRELGPAETEARAMTRESNNNDAVVIQMLARVLDDTRRDLAAHMEDCPHIEPPRSRNDELAIARRIKAGIEVGPLLGLSDLSEYEGLGSEVASGLRRIGYEPVA